MKKFLGIVVLGLLLSNNAYANLSMIGSDDFWIGFVICIPIFIFMVFQMRKDNEPRDKARKKNKKKNQSVQDILKELDK